ncbi:hypothetical protein EmuJ_000838000 [Echinococcus multilocularis]|uniref:Uncharacterized protein n=1 Tax=Echinococcus multilocularis TaxID=6211 RepID=A0A068YEK3_ECHMU|nr:hypothetical protein EmuJ_000838000 [Echinococcus multilocularis]
MNIQETTGDDFKKNYVTISTVCASDLDEAPCETEDHFIESKFSPLFRHFERIRYSMGSIKRKGKKLDNSLDCTNTEHRRLTEEGFYDQCLDRHCTTHGYLQAKFALYDSRMSS